MFDLIEDRGSYTSAQLDSFTGAHQGYSAGFVTSRPTEEV